jgi:hypothetical protein
MGGAGTRQDAHLEAHPPQAADPSLRDRVADLTRQVFPSVHRYRPPAGRTCARRHRASDAHRAAQTKRSRIRAPAVKADGKFKGDSRSESTEPCRYRCAMTRGVNGFTPRFRGRSPATRATPGHPVGDPLSGSVPGRAHPRRAGPYGKERRNDREAARGRSRRLTPPGEAAPSGTALRLAGKAGARRAQAVASRLTLEGRARFWALNLVAPAIHALGLSPIGAFSTFYRLRSRVVRQIGRLRTRGFHAAVPRRVSGARPAVPGS